MGNTGFVAAHCGHRVTYGAVPITNAHNATGFRPTMR
jgi:hypothetical protein